MKEYQFQYTKTWETLVVLLTAIAVFILTEMLGLQYKLNFWLIIILGCGLAFLLFQTFKRKAVHTCTAKLGDSAVIFVFENRTTTINFNDLVAYKFYSDKNGQILYLKNNLGNFKIIVNNNFCKTDNFEEFCDDIILKLDKYRDLHNSKLIHGGSMFATKVFLYFLVIGTLLYLVAFFFETNRLRMVIWIAGGFFLLIMWMKYFIGNKKQKTENSS